MKKSTLLASIFALSAISFGSMAAEEVQHSNQPASGYVSVTGAISVNELTEQLAKKADEAGAKSFRIISAGGENSMNGVAAIYK